MANQLLIHPRKALDRQQVPTDESPRPRVIDDALARGMALDELHARVADALWSSPILRDILAELVDTPFTPGEPRHLHPDDATRLGNHVAELADQLSAGEG